MMLGSLLAFLQAGCFIGPEDCADCGECGILGGPNQANSIELGDVGENAAGTPAVELDRWKQGACGGDTGAQYYWMLLEAGAVSVVAQSTPGGLDTSHVGTQGSTYVWSDQDLTLSVERNEPEWSFHFVQATVPIDVLCVPTDTAISCDAQ